MGEAKISRTIFGGAKVRVVHEHEKKLRAALLVVLVVIAIAAAAWQGWIIFQRMQNVPPAVPLSERISVSAPVFRPAHIAPDPHPSRRHSVSLIQTEINSMLSGPLPRRPPALVQSKPAAVQAVTPEPLAVNTPQATQEAAVTDATASQTDTQLSNDPATPVQPTATTTQPAGNLPSEVVPLAGPLVKRDTSTPPSTSNAQPLGTVKVQN